MPDVEKQRESNVGGVTGKGFMPGQSGNPAGRVKGTSFKTYLRQEADRLHADGRPRLHRVADTAMGLAEDGDIRAIAFVADRIDGKVAQKLTLEEAPKPTLRDLRATLRDRAKRVQPLRAGPGGVLDEAADDRP